MVRLPDAAGQPGRPGRPVTRIKDINRIKDIREMPVRMLRGFFTGIGQLLLAADRFRVEEARREDVNQDELYGPPTGLDGEPAARQMTTADYVRSAAGAEQAAMPAPGRHRKPARASVAGRSGAGRKRRGTSPRTFRSLDATGNVRLLTPDMPAESASRGDRPTAKSGTSKTSAAAKPKGRAARSPTAAADLPVAGYDELSLASIRARLRYLDAKQLRILLEHEKSASNRADVVTMFERRLAKIESGPHAN
jgi:hypothetical protein